MAVGAIHSLSLVNRDTLDVSGVISVLVFDSDYILIELESDKLTIEGSDLRLVNLIQDKKEVQISGKIKGLFYQDGNSKRTGLFKKK